METCLVFTPDDPCVYTLNASAWLIFELCDGRPWDEMQSAYCAAVAPLTPDSEARQQLEAGIDRLRRQNLIRAETASTSPPSFNQASAWGDRING
jgi:hypothetical protein